MKIGEHLAALFPTAASILKAREPYTSWAHMAKSLGLTKNSLYEHRKALGMKMVKAGVRKSSRSCKDQLTAPEINANITKLMQGKSKNIVTCYKITDLEAFKQDQRGYENLELIGTEHGSNWGQVSHKVSAIKGR